MNLFKMYADNLFAENPSLAMVTIIREEVPALIAKVWRKENPLLNLDFEELIIWKAGNNYRFDYWHGWTVLKYEVCREVA